MSRFRKVFTIGGTFAAALGIGFVMQNGDALASRLGNASTQVQPPQPPIVLATIEVDPSDPAYGPVLSAPVMTIAEHDGLVLPGPVVGPRLPDAPVRLAAINSELPAGDFLPAQTAPGTECEISLAATAAPAAMLAMTVVAPCAPSTQFVVHHQGMMFSALTDDAGSINLVLPALATTAVVMVEFPNGQAGVATASVPDFESYDRAVLLWQGDKALQIHAREFGADYGDDGHVWYGATGNPAEAGHGFLMRLGDDVPSEPSIADIYTYPSGTSSRDGNILLTVEAEITDANCGRDVTAQSLQFRPGEDAFASDLTMRMPDCGAIGDFLVLKNMFADLTLASK